MEYQERINAASYLIDLYTELSELKPVERQLNDIWLEYVEEGRMEEADEIATDLHQTQEEINRVLLEIEEFKRKL